jgi:hypothetical protein
MFNLCYFFWGLKRNIIFLLIFSKYILLNIFYLNKCKCFLKTWITLEHEVFVWTGSSWSNSHCAEVMIRTLEHEVFVCTCSSWSNSHCAEVMIHYFSTVTVRSWTTCSNEDFMLQCIRSVSITLYQVMLILNIFKF